MDPIVRENLRSEVAAVVRERRTSIASEVRFVPRSDYVDQGRLSLERSTLFRQYPLAITLSARLANPNDFVTENVAGLPLLIVRGGDGVARAFINACRHRGNVVCPETSGNKTRFTCNYHAWTYNAKGELQSFIDRTAFDGLDVKDFSLVELPSEELHGFVWVVPTPGASINVSEYLGEVIDREIADFKLAGQVVFTEDTLRRDFNWKLGMDTFQEVFHVNILHRDSLKGLFNGLSTFEGLGRHYRFTTIRSTFPDSDANNEEIKGDIRPHTSIVYLLFPNTLLIWQMDHIEVWHVYPAPDSDDKCEMRVLLVVPEPPDERSTRYWNRNWEVLQGSVWKEDFDTMTVIQKNLKSGAVGQFVFGRNEAALQYHHDRIDEAVELDASWSDSVSG